MHDHDAHAAMPRVLAQPQGGRRKDWTRMSTLAESFSAGLAEAVLYAEAHGTQ